MSAAPIQFRPGPALDAQIGRAGPNTSAVLRAYVLLGMAATGMDMAPFRKEIARATAEDLAPEIVAALARCTTGVVQVSYTLPPSVADPMVEEIDADPFMAGLIEV